MFNFPFVLGDYVIKILHWKTFNATIYSMRIIILFQNIIIEIFYLATSCPSQPEQLFKQNAITWRHSPEFKQFKLKNSLIIIHLQFLALQCNRFFLFFLFFCLLVAKRLSRVARTRSIGLFTLIELQCNKVIATKKKNENDIRPINTHSAVCVRAKQPKRLSSVNNCIQICTQTYKQC